MRDVDFRRWLKALESLPASTQAEVDLELSQVNEMAEVDTLRLLTAAASPMGLPPDSIPTGAALSLWFFLHRSSVFQETFLRHEILGVEAWRTARAPPGITVDDPERACVALGETLKELFRMHEGSGRFCAIESHHLRDSIYFVANVSDRLQLLSLFDGDGKYVLQAARPALPLLFAYSPREGRLMLNTRQRSRERLFELFQRFGRAVLGINLDRHCLIPAMRLELLKRRFDPFPDAADMEMVRVKSLHLGYPGRGGRRRVKLETLSTDDKFAIMDLLQEHGGSTECLNQLDVLYAELQVKLRIPGGTKTFPVRLWPDRTSLNQTPLGSRLEACLRRWGIVHGE